MDDVLEVALAKNPSIRTNSVGALAAAVGEAYGLHGDHRTWATTPQAELAKLISEAVWRQPSARVPAAIESAADPFAAPASKGGTSPMAQPLGAPASQAYAPHSQVQPAAPHAGYGSSDPTMIPGLESQRPQWLIPVAVGIVALVLGGGIAIVLAR
jgi:hypothetical protein